MIDKQYKDSREIYRSRTKCNSYRETFSFVEKTENLIEKFSKIWAGNPSLLKKN